MSSHFICLDEERETFGRRINKYIQIILQTHGVSVIGIPLKILQWTCEYGTPLNRILTNVIYRGISKFCDSLTFPCLWLWIDHHSLGPWIGLYPYYLLWIISCCMFDIEENNLFIMYACLLIYICMIIYMAIYLGIYLFYFMFSF